MSRLNRAALALGVLAMSSTAACIRTRTDPVTGKVSVGVKSPLQKGEDWNAKVTGMAPYTSANGEARAEVLRGATTLTIRVEGLRAGDVHGWRVNEGRCGEPGIAFGDAYAYGNITVSSQGVAEGAAKLNEGLDIVKKYKVRLFASPSDSTTIVACGDLSTR
jgi:hypothetical protein